MTRQERLGFIRRPERPAHPSREESERLERGGRVTGRDRRSALVEQPLEAARVELVGRRLEHIPRECAEELGFEDLADLRDVDTHRRKTTEKEEK